LFELSEGLGSITDNGPLCLTCQQIRYERGLGANLLWAGYAGAGE